MKKILFVIPSLKTGGANSALDALYLNLREKYCISVFSISHQPRNNNYSFDEVLIKEEVMLSLLFTDFSLLKGLNKVIAFFIKAVQTSLRLIGVELGFLYARHIIKHLESQSEYNCIVGFQEGYTTKFVSLFNNNNKIAWIHCDYNNYLSQDKSEEEIYLNFKRIVCVSDYTSSVFSSQYPALAARTMSIHNLINEDKVKQSAETIIDDIRSIPDAFIILSAGRFSKVKRFREIPQVASKLVGRGLKFEWYIIGPQDDDEEMKSFNTNIEQYNVQSYVRWLGNKANPYPYFKMADMYVCLSSSEACPMVFKEAKVFQLPIVTTNFPSSFEFIHEGDGLISPLDSIADSIETIYVQRKKGVCYTGSGEDDRKIVMADIERLFG